jgi:hypothetical protein
MSMSIVLSLLPLQLVYNKKVASNKLSLLLKIQEVKHTNITTKLNWKLYTKGIKNAKLIGLGSDRQRV